MIKVIKPGKYHIVTCPECKCEFSYEDEDVQLGGPYDDTFCAYSKEVECPCCKNRIDICKIR